MSRLILEYYKCTTRNSEGSPAKTQGPGTAAPSQTLSDSLRNEHPARTESNNH